jgi:hypothetical protein
MEAPSAVSAGEPEYAPLVRTLRGFTLRVAGG